MYGAIVGDLAGSIYEYEQIKGIKPVIMNNLIEDNSFYSDDTILTIAIKDAILHGSNYECYLKEYIKEYEEYKPLFKPYFKSAFSPNIIEWMKGNRKGDSKGNGALMRISPIVSCFDNEKEIVRETRLATIPSHNSEEAIESTKILALVMYMLKKGIKLEEVYNILHLEPKYKPFKKFNTTCYETLNNCLYVVSISNSFNDSIVKTLLMGGDTDTNAAIVGSITEYIYGIEDSIKTRVKSKIPEEFVKILKM